jgi:D-alanyl-D-alanine carboxypeptidase
MLPERLSTADHRSRIRAAIWLLSIALLGSAVPGAAHSSAPLAGDGAAAGISAPTPQPSGSGPRSLHLIDEPAPPPRAVQVVAPEIPSPAARAAEPQRAAEILAALERGRSAFGVPGVALALAGADGTSWSTGSGVGLLAQGGEPVDGTTPFGIGSVTKTFVAALVLKLVEEGRLGLGDRLGDHLPAAGRFANVTVEQLLAHTSGVADFYAPMRSRLMADPARRWSSEELLAAVGGARFAPAAGWAYSNTNYALLGMLAEAVAGAPVAAELERRFLAPLMLDSVALDEGRSIDGRQLLPLGWGSAFSTSGAMTASATDLARWAAALYAGDVLGDATRAAMVTFSDHGYGLGTQRLSVAGRQAVGHTGLLGHYTTLMVWLPEERVAIAISANRSTQVSLAALLAHRTAGAASVMDLVLQPSN